MKIYTAAMYGKMEEMRQVSNKLRLLGHVCTARWVLGDESNMPQPAAAQMDLDDIDIADCVLLFTNQPKTMFSGGGRFVEFGYALAKGKRIVIVGGRENIFCHLDYVSVHETLEAALQSL